MTRMVAYAVAAMKAPKTAQDMATARSAGVDCTGGRIPPCWLTLSVSTSLGSWEFCLASSTGNRKGGRATNKTPANAMAPANASLTVKGS